MGGRLDQGGSVAVKEEGRIKGSKQNSDHPYQVVGLVGTVEM